MLIHLGAGRSPASPDVFFKLIEATWDQVGFNSFKTHTGWGPQDSVQLPCKWLKSMVYGRYNYSIHGCYKPTYNWGAPSCTQASICFRNIRTSPKKR